MTRVWEVSFRNIVIEGDCLVLINCLKSSRIVSYVLFELGILVADILSLSKSFSFISWSHTKRLGNEVAHGTSSADQI